MATIGIFFGLGDQDTYPESFVDGMGVMFDVLFVHAGHGEFYIES